MCFVSNVFVMKYDVQNKKKDFQHLIMSVEFSIYSTSGQRAIRTQTIIGLFDWKIVLHCLIHAVSED